MSSVNSTSPFDRVPNEVTLHILSHLDKRSLQAVACVSKNFHSLVDDFQIWKPRVEREFEAVIVRGAKQPNKSWRQTYEELTASRDTRVANVARVLHVHQEKVIRDDLHHRIGSAAATLLGIPRPSSGSHYTPTSQTGWLDGRKITVYTSTHQ